MAPWFGFSYSVKWVFSHPPPFFLGYFSLSHSRDFSALTSSLLFYTYSYLSVCSPLKHLLSALSLCHISCSHCLSTQHFFAAFSVSSHLTNYILSITRITSMNSVNTMNITQTLNPVHSTIWHLCYWGFVKKKQNKKTDVWIRHVIGKQQRHSHSHRSNIY